MSLRGSKSNIRITSYYKVIAIAHEYGRSHYTRIRVCRQLTARTNWARLALRGVFHTCPRVCPHRTAPHSLCTVLKILR